MRPEQLWRERSLLVLLGRIAIRQRGWPTGGRCERREAERFELGKQVLVVATVSEVVASITKHLVAVGINDEEARQRDTVTLVGIEHVHRLQISLAARIAHVQDVWSRPTNRHRRRPIVTVDADCNDLGACVADSFAQGCQLHELATAIWSPIAPVRQEHHRTVLASEIENVCSDVATQCHAPILTHLRGARRPVAICGGQRTCGRRVRTASGAVAEGASRQQRNECLDDFALLGHAHGVGPIISSQAVGDTDLQTPVSTAQHSDQ